MKKIVKLTETQLNRIVKKVVKEDVSHLRPGRKSVHPRPATDAENRRGMNSWFKKYGGERKRNHPAPKNNPDMEYNDFGLEEQVENPEMSGSWNRKSYQPTPREEEVMGVFGERGEDVLPVVIRYMRKNPDSVLRRLAKMYPEIYMRHVPNNSEMEYNDFDTDAPLDEAVIEVDPDDQKSIDTVKGKLDDTDTLRVRDLDD